MKYATGNLVVTEISGAVEHVEFCGIGGKASILLIAPCTANTIGKIAHGIDDTTVTTFATTAFGSGIPIMIVPAMHESMYNHPIVIENIGKLGELGVEFINPVLEEGAAKIASTDEIILRVERALCNKTLKGKRIIITGGGALLKNLDKRLREETQLPVFVTEDPLTSVVLGAGKLLDDLDLLKKIALD